MRKYLVLIMAVMMLNLLLGAEKDEVTISLVGDMCFDGKVEERVEEFGGDFLFEGYREYIEKSDFVIGNLETSVSERGVAVKGKSFTFRSKPEILKVLKKNKVKIVSIGNNHILDFGTEAFKDTIKNLRINGMGYSGGALKKSEENIFPVIKINGIKIGFIAFSKVIPYVKWHVKDKIPGVMGIYPEQEKEALKLIKDTKKRCDILIVSVHWGKERAIYPEKKERVLARSIIDSGADIVMGHHTHSVQEYEYYKGKPIFYSLGNFIFNNSNVKRCNKTVMAVVKINKNLKIEKVDMIRGEIYKNIPLAYSSSIYKQLKKSEKKLSFGKK